MRGVVAALALAFTAGAAPGIDALAPGPALPRTAKLAVARGTGARRLALWTATNARNELCVGFRLGAKATPPKSFACLRRGLERPLLTVEAGGGAGGQIEWGELVGLASPSVAGVSVAAGGLKPLRGFPGWRVFASGAGSRPPGEVSATAADGHTLVDDTGIWIRPRAGATANWTGTFAKIPEKPANEGAISIALADPAIRSILAQNPAWLDSSPGARWVSCGGRRLGVVLSFRFARPASFTAVLPVLGRASGHFAYSESTQRLVANDLLELNVSVDTNVGAVVGVDGRAYDAPLAVGATEGSLTSAGTIAAPHDAGGPDNGTCPPDQTSG